MNNIKEYLQRTINIILLFLFVWIVAALCIANKIDYAGKVNWKIVKKLKKKRFKK